MKDIPNLSSRLSSVKKDLEAVSAGQRYHFRSLVTKISLMPGLYDLQADALFGDNFYRITAIPNNGKRLPLNLDVRHRVANPDVMANPGYDSTSRYTVYYRKIPDENGVHTLDISYVAPGTETVYFKIIATGMDDYTIYMTPLSP